MFETLNRITAGDLLRRIESCGFRTLRQKRDRIDVQPPAALLDAYREDALKTFQVAVLLQKP